MLDHLEWSRIWPTSSVRVSCTMMVQGEQCACQMKDIVGLYRPNRTAQNSRLVLEFRSESLCRALCKMSTRRSKATIPSLQLLPPSLPRVSNLSVYRDLTINHCLAKSQQMEIGTALTLAHTVFLPTTFAMAMTVMSYSHRQDHGLRMTCCLQFMLYLAMSANCITNVLAAISARCALLLPPLTME